MTPYIIEFIFSANNKFAFEKDMQPEEVRPFIDDFYERIIYTHHGDQQDQYVSFPVSQVCVLNIFQKVDMPAAQPDISPEVQA